MSASPGPSPATPEVFDTHMDAWTAWQDSPWGRLRYRLVGDLLDRHLGPAESAQRVLDLGGGDGADSVPLAVAGHDVTVADSSRAMLDLAERRARERGVAVAAVMAGVGDRRLLPEGNDVVLLHNVIQYCPDLADVLAAAVGAARPGGLVSVIATNPVMHVLRAAVRDLDPAAALAMLGAPTVHTVTFDHAVRRITWQEAAAALERAGADVVQRYGVLCVNHLVTDDERKHDPDFAADLERLELAVADRDPYRDIAAMWMLVARRRAGSA
ncbi:class I SAM-dependent methyltransferase [Angustibacter luteus]|uniref:Class I SAM-dependent methyltransferase n=1 Tax=Angustibacter luteus TaxID=658456 RepID=A0ABW1J9Z7_9ACTN